MSRAATLEQRLDKARVYAEHARTSVGEALFQLELMRPLVSDRAILDPLNQTYAAHALNLLQWTLFGSAALNLCKAVFDTDERSGSLAVLMRMLESSELLAAVRTKRTAPIETRGSRPPQLRVEEWRAFRSRWAEEDRAREEAEFDRMFPTLRAELERLQTSELGVRLKNVRNKLLAHGDVLIRDGHYHGAAPEHFGLRWGDAEAFAVDTSALTERVFIVIFGHDLGHDETRNVFREYSEDLWRHLRNGLAATES